MVPVRLTDTETVFQKKETDANKTVLENVAGDVVSQGTAHTGQKRIGVASFAVVFCADPLYASLPFFGDRPDRAEQPGGYGAFVGCIQRAVGRDKTVKPDYARHSSRFRESRFCHRWTWRRTYFSVARCGGLYRISAVPPRMAGGLEYSETKRIRRKDEGGICRSGKQPTT